jgi:hypothetical protein
LLSRDFNCGEESGFLRSSMNSWHNNFKSSVYSRHFSIGYLLPFNSASSSLMSLGDSLLSGSIETWDIVSDISEHTDSISTCSSSTMSLHCSA